MLENTDDWGQKRFTRRNGRERVNPRSRTYLEPLEYQSQRGEFPDVLDESLPQYDWERARKCFQALTDLIFDLWLKRRKIIKGGRCPYCEAKGDLAAHWWINVDCRLKYEAQFVRLLKLWPCLNCGTDAAMLRGFKYCSPKCWRSATTTRQRENRNYRRREFIRKCKVCGKKLARLGQKYCGNTCRQQGWRNRVGV